MADNFGGIAALDEDALADLITPRSTVAVSDGIGAPYSAFGPLSRIAAAAGGVRLLLGWLPEVPAGLEPSAFDDVGTVMAGYGLRDLVDTGAVHYIPCRLAAVPALLNDVARPAVLVASIVRGADGGWRFATEVSWMRAAVQAGATVAGIERTTLPCADAGEALPSDRVIVVGADSTPAVAVAFGSPTDLHRAAVEHVVTLVPPGARLQYPPGALGSALLEALTAPVAIDTGMITDGVVDLTERGLLLDEPISPYLAGDRVLSWADGRPILHPVEFTHDPIRLSTGRPLIAVNTALEVDLDGQVNVEAARGSAIAGIGGQPDYALAATRCSGGLSILALPTQAAGRTTLVEQLSAPVSTPSHDFDVVVTESGFADLRGRDRAERRRAIAALWAAT